MTSMKIGDINGMLPRPDVDTYEHVLGDASKAIGELHGLGGDADHIGEARMGDAPMPDMAEAFALAEEARGKPAAANIAELVVCAARLAALCPSGAFDLEEAVAACIAGMRDHADRHRPDERRTDQHRPDDRPARELSTGPAHLSLATMKANDAILFADDG